MSISSDGGAVGGANTVTLASCSDGVCSAETPTFFINSRSVRTFFSSRAAATPPFTAPPPIAPTPKRYRSKLPPPSDEEAAKELRQPASKKKFANPSRHIHARRVI